MWTIIIVFGVFGLWASIAPIDSAAIAQGYLVLDNKRKKIQHLEGGIVSKIYVKDGDVVEEGQKLLLLDQTSTKARLDLYMNKFIVARAARARLVAERDGKEHIDFPEDLLELAKTDQTVRESLQSQQQIFSSRRKNTQGQTAILNQKIAQYNEEIQGLRAQERSATQQISLLNEEINVVRTLLKQGNAMKPRLLALERQSAALMGQRGEYRATISRAEQSIAESRINIINLQNDFMKEVVAELKDTQVQISELEEQIRASDDTFKRINIVANTSGVITNLKVFTEGGVITPGETLMEIVPYDDLVVEARVNPQDIDVVHPGLEALVRLTAYKSREIPPLMGKLEHVSADRLEDERTGMPYYLARVRIPQENIDEYEELKPQAGMPADVLIVTGSRTMVQYVLDPLSASFRHAFREE